MATKRSKKQKRSKSKAKMSVKVKGTPREVRRAAAWLAEGALGREGDPFRRLRS